MARATKTAVSAFLLKLIFGAWVVFFFFDGAFLSHEIVFITRVLLWVTSAIAALLLAGIVLLLLGMPDRFQWGGT
jgi:hypothetical protein